MDRSLGQDVFVCDTPEEAQRIMEERSGCRVLPCVYPTLCRTTYYISENAILYGLRYHKQLCKFQCYRSLPVKNRKYLAYGISIRKGVNPTHVNAEQLVYCTFVLGEWSEDVKICFKDGNRFNVVLANLEEKGKVLSPCVSEHMSVWCKTYKEYYDFVVQFCRYKNFLTTEDAQDIVSQSFINLMAMYDSWTHDTDMVGLWIHNSNHLAIAFSKRQERLVSLSIDGMESIASLCVLDRSYEVDLLEPLRGDMRKVIELKMQDVSQADIALELDLSGRGGTSYLSKG